MSGLNLALVAFTVFFGATANLHNPPLDRPQTPVAQQPYAWSGRTGDLTVKLWLVQDRDSVFARGSYQVAPTKNVGCGGETLPDKGLVTMRAKGTFSAFRGRLLFDSGWTPPFRATRTSASAMSGSIMSIDRGPCIMKLRRVMPTRHTPTGGVG